MAAPMQIDLTMGERLRIIRSRQRRELRDVAREAQALLPPSLSMSRETLRRLEVGIISEDKANPVHIAALAQVYGVRISDISPPAAEALGTVDLLIRSTGCTHDVLVGRAA